MVQVTGKRLRVGDKVRMARSTVGPTPHKDRELGTTSGVILQVIPRAKPRARVRVLWESGSIGYHEADMIVCEDQND